MKETKMIPKYTGDSGKDYEVPKTTADGVYAFPAREVEQLGRTQSIADRIIYTKGMTLRDYFAGQALTGETASQDDTYNWSGKEDGLSKHCYKIADAMMKERDR